MIVIICITCEFRKIKEKQFNFLSNNYKLRKINTTSGSPRVFATD
jgi:hypothetical protein